MEPLTLNKLFDKFKDHPEEVKNFAILFPVMDQDGNVTGFRALSPDSMWICNVQLITTTNAGRHERAIVLGPHNFDLQEYYNNEMIVKAFL